MPEQLSDAILLERYVSFREEAAFVALVERHGPLVQRICRRILRNEHDVEDVFQATFLVLARRAAAVPWRESVGRWLGAVAHRLAMGARSDETRHKRRETAMTTLLTNRSSGHVALEAGLPEELHPTADPFTEVEQREAGRLLKDELLRLPEKYRSPVVLCYLQGRTHEEAARQLGYPAGSMSRRLKRAQAILRRRLIHRGLSFTVGLFVVSLALFSVWSICRNPGESAALRSAMSSLEPFTDGETGIKAVIARIDRGGSDLDREQIVALTARTTHVAEEIERHEPSMLPEQWRQYLSEMRLSSVSLAQAARKNDRSSMLAAARRLNASCVGCHTAFCQSAGETDPSIDSLVPRTETSQPSDAQPRVSGLIFQENPFSAAQEVGSETDGATEVTLILAQR